MDRVKKVRIADNLYTIMDEEGRAAIASDYDSSLHYSYGSVVFNGNKLYMSKVPGTTGEWADNDWEEVNIPSLLGHVFAMHERRSILYDDGWSYALNVDVGDDESVAESQPIPIGRGLVYESYELDDYLVAVKQSSEYDDWDSSIAEPYPQILNECIVLPSMSSFMGVASSSNSNWVKFFFIRKDGGEITQNDIQTLNQNTYVTGLFFDEASENVDLHNIIHNNYGTPIYNNDNPLEFNDYRESYPGQDDEEYEPYSAWSDWIPAEGGAVVEVGLRWYIDTYGFANNCAFSIDAYYEDSENSIEPAEDILGSTAAFVVGKPYNSGIVFIPGTANDTYGNEWKLKAIQISVGRVDGELIEEVDWTDGSVFNVYTKGDVEADGISVRRLEPNNKDAVKQFLEVVEGWYDYFPDYAIEQVTYNDVYIGAPTNIDKKSGPYDVGIDSAYFVLCCLKGLTAGSDTWMSWNRDLLLNYKNPAFPWSENPSEYFNNSDKPIEYIGGNK